MSHSLARCVHADVQVLMLLACQACRQHDSRNAAEQLFWLKRTGVRSGQCVRHGSSSTYTLALSTLQRFLVHLEPSPLLWPIPRALCLPRMLVVCCKDQDRRVCRGARVLYLSASVMPRSWARGPGAYLFPADPSSALRVSSPHNAVDPVNHDQPSHPTPRSILAHLRSSHSCSAIFWQHNPMYATLTGSDLG